MLAIALADPDVDNPCRYFGWMAKQDPRGAPDLRLNLVRILKARGLALPPAHALATTSRPAPKPPLPTSVQPPPGTDDPTWLAIVKPLRAIVREGAYGSWFARDKIERDFIPAILTAAEAAELEVRRVLVSVRRSS